MGSEVDVEQAVEIVPGTQIAKKEFWQLDIDLFAGRKTSKDEKYALSTSGRQPGKNYPFPGVVQGKTEVLQRSNT